jgi:hypothetical protein
MEITFFCYYVESGCLERWYYCSDVFLVSFQVVTVDKNIIQTSCAECIQVWLYCTFDELMKRHWGIGMSEGHNHEFKPSIAGPECNFPFISSCDSNDIIRIAEVELGVIVSF